MNNNIYYFYKAKYVFRVTKLIKEKDKCVRYKLIIGCCQFISRDYMYLSDSPDVISCNQGLFFQHIATDTICNFKIKSLETFSHRFGGCSSLVADFWSRGLGFDPRYGNPFPTDWIGVSIMCVAETGSLVSPLCLCLST